MPPRLQGERAAVYTQERFPLVAFGASLGGNVLLKWLGEHPGQRLLVAAATNFVSYKDVSADPAARAPDAEAAIRVMTS